MWSLVGRSLPHHIPIARFIFLDVWVVNPHILNIVSFLLGAHLFYIPTQYMQVIHHHFTVTVVSSCTMRALYYFVYQRFFTENQPSEKKCFMEIPSLSIGINSTMPSPCLLVNESSNQPFNQCLLASSLQGVFRYF